MKIYNKKTFWYGIGFIVLGTLQLMISIWKGFDLKGTVILLSHPGFPCLGSKSFSR